VRVRHRRADRIAGRPHLGYRALDRLPAYLAAAPDAHGGIVESLPVSLRKRSTIKDSGPFYPGFAWSVV
jgi:hypothetical protein